MSRLNKWSTSGGYGLTTRYIGMGKRNHMHVNIQIKERMTALIGKNKHKRISRFVF